MKRSFRPAIISAALVLLSSAVLANNSYGQSASLRVQVSDQNGAVVAGAKVTVHGPNNLARTATTDDGGSYSFANLAPGDYTVEASAPSLALQEPAKITLHAGGQSLNLQLNVFVPEQKITVENNRAAVSTDSNSN